MRPPIRSGSDEAGFRGAIRLGSPGRGRAPRAACPGRKVRRWLIAAGWLLAAAAATAQLGDAAGERQESPVPEHLIPPAPALSPGEALATFRLPRGLRLEFAAVEPLVQDPVAITFGPDGRMWVVEMRGFMPNLDGRGEDAPVGRVVVLRDRNGDGRYDDSQVFLEGLVLPRTVMLAAGGVLVGAPPELAWWRDADGDGRADQKEVLAADYGVKVDPDRPYLANPELAPNGLLWGRDNWIYSAAYTRKFRRIGDRWESAPTSFRGQWGLSQDDWGRLYHNANADQLRVDVIPPEYLRRHPHHAMLAGANVAAATDQRVWPGRVTPGVNRGYQPGVLDPAGRLQRFTAACAPWIYRGDLLPQFQGDAFVAEPAANLVRRNVIRSEGGAVTARNAYPQDEFITSTDERFRPVNFATGPDGALYIVDFYRGVLQHRLSLTTYLRRQSIARDLVEPRHFGRIYRVVPANARPSRATRIAPILTGEWIERLGHANAWWRETAQQILVEQGDRSTVRPIREFLRRTGAAGRVQALWTLQGLGAIEHADVLAGLADSEPIVRATAIRLAEPLLAGPQRAGLLPLLLRGAGDASPEVRLQAVLSLGAACDEEVDYALARAVRAHPEQPYLHDALLSGIAGRELPLLERIFNAAEGRRNIESARPLLSGLASAVFASRRPAVIERVLVLAAAENAPDFLVDAVVSGLAEATGRERRPVMMPRRPEGWTLLGGKTALRPKLALVDKALRWPGKPGVAERAPPPLTAREQERFETGREIYRGICAGCHQASGTGLDGLAPPLLDSEWVLGNPQRVIRVLLHGLTGPIKVRKQSYTGDMPGFGHVLDDSRIAAVLTYIRREWDHDADPVSPERVAAERAATVGHSGPWSQEELRARNVNPGVPQ